MAGTWVTTAPRWSLPGGGAGGRARDSGTAAASAAAALVAQPQRPPVHIIPSPVLRGFGCSGSSALRLYCPRPVSSAPSLLLPSPLHTHTHQPSPPPARAMSPPASRVSTILIRSLCLSSRHVSESTRTLCSCSLLASPPPCDHVLLLGGSYSGSHRTKSL